MRSTPFRVNFHGNNTTHFDALSHFIFNGHIYNGFPASSITNWGAEKNDVMPFKDGMVTRGVLIDWPRFKNVPYMGDDEAIYAEDLDAWEKKTGVKIESGDCVLLRTGRWKRVADKGPLDLNVKAPGLYASCAKWLKERNIALLGSDVVQDVRPSRVEGVNQPIHQLFLVAVGTPLFDNCDLEAAASRPRNSGVHFLHDGGAVARARRNRLAVQSARTLLMATFPGQARPSRLLGVSCSCSARRNSGAQLFVQRCASLSRRGRRRHRSRPRPGGQSPHANAQFRRYRQYHSQGNPRRNACICPSRSRGERYRGIRAIPQCQRLRLQAAGDAAAGERFFFGAGNCAFRAIPSAAAEVTPAPISRTSPASPLWRNWSSRSPIPAPALLPDMAWSTSL
jgi:kynurenine formamidase